MGVCLPTVTVRLKAGSLSPSEVSQSVSGPPSQAAAQSVTLRRKWRLQELDQTLPTTDFLLGGRQEKIRDAKMTRDS